MPEETIKRISTFADSWWKILSLLGAIVLIIYEISMVWLKISQTEAELKTLKEEIKKEFQIRDERSDKRYDRATIMYEELKNDQLNLESELEEHLIDAAYQKGKNE